MLLIGVNYHPSFQTIAFLISDNGPQFIARDFKEFIRISGMTHVGTSPSYPQSNGKLERWHKSLKSESTRPGTRLRIIAAFVYGVHGLVLLRRSRCRTFLRCFWQGA
jgi:transposase InsO family protein